MSILATNKKSENRAFLISAAASLLCMLITSIYYKFSHEVYSDYMSYMFLVPFVFGALFYGTMSVCRQAPSIGRFAFNIYNSGIVTLTVGCMLKGIISIAGAESPYTIYFFMSGIAMILMGLVLYALQLINSDK